MRRNILAALLLFIGTSLLWLVLCWNWWGCTPKKSVQENVQKQDSVINYNVGEYDRLLQEQIELYKQLRTYEDAQLTAKTTYKRTRSAIIIRDTINRVDVITLVNSCDSVIASDSLVINNLKEQINIEEQKIDNLQEVVEAYEQKENILTEEINNLVADKKKLEKQKKRRNHALVVTSTVAILSTFVLSILL
jgi:DNA repair exonuclease SbcCD ATPase subunit